MTRNRAQGNRHGPGVSSRSKCPVPPFPYTWGQRAPLCALLCFIKPIYIRSQGLIVSEPMETHPRSEIAHVPTPPVTRAANFETHIDGIWISKLTNRDFPLVKSVVTSIRTLRTGCLSILVFLAPLAEVTPYAGRRTDFRDKKLSDFSGEIFRERNYCPRTAFSGSNS